MMLGTEDTDILPGLIRAAFARAGEPKRLPELHYSVYPWVKRHNFDNTEAWNEVPVR
jgi:hypothetical protein